MSTTEHRQARDAPPRSCSVTHFHMASHTGQEWIESCDQQLGFRHWGSTFLDHWLSCRDRVLETTGRVLETADRVLETTGRVLEITGRVLETSGRVLEITGRVLKTAN